MVRRNINIPATLVRNVRGKQYQLNGTLLSINESNDTCTMSFQGRGVRRNIPLDSVLINEGLLDTIKQFGKKIANYITSKIKGLFVLIDEKTHEMFPGSDRNIGNIALNSRKFRGVSLSLAPEVASNLGLPSMSLEQTFAESMNRDIDEINRYWGRVIKEAGTTDKTIAESISYVNKKYYRPVDQALTEAMKNSVNEAVVYDFNNIQFGGNSKKSKVPINQYGAYGNIDTIATVCLEAIQDQMAAGIGGTSYTKIPIIWGAPGIGKTSIMFQVADILRETDDIELHVQVIQCSGMTKENWTLPHDTSDTFEYANDSVKADYADNDHDPTVIVLHKFTDTAKSWLPVYEYVPDPDALEVMDNFFNTCSFLARKPVSKSGKPYSGGIVFFDEFTRCSPAVHDTMFNLGSDRRFGDNYVVASGWSFVYAANRSVDDSKADTDDERYWLPAAADDRFIHMLFVPDRHDWIKWARKINQTTGFANVEPFIVDFIEAMDDSVWYPTVVNGGYDDVLGDDAKAAKLAHTVGDYDEATGAVQDVLDKLKYSRRVVTPRDWKRWSDQYRLELGRLFKKNLQHMDADDYIKTLIDKSKVQVDVDNTNVPDGFEPATALEYYGGIAPDVLVDALNMDISAEDWDKWVRKKGGEDRLNPTKTRGKYTRYNMLMTWFIEKIRSQIGDDIRHGYENSKTPLIQSWRSYLEYDRVFTSKVMNSIWNTHEMPEGEYKDDDDKVPANLEGNVDFNSTKYSKWKQSPTIVYQVLDKVFSNYPGDIVKDANDDVVAMSKDITAGMSDADVIKEAKKLQKQLTIRVINKDYSQLVIPDNILDKPDILRAAINSLNTKVGKKLVNFALWVSKVTLQTTSGGYASRALTMIHDLTSPQSETAVLKDAKYAVLSGMDKQMLAKSQFDKAKATGDKNGQIKANIMTQIAVYGSPLTLPEVILNAVAGNELEETRKLKIN